jgi:hypothetical protein
MPQVIVAADAADGREEFVMLRERISTADLESNHFATRLVERLAWAVSDAREAERPPDQRTCGQRRQLTDKTRSASVGGCT